MGRKSIALTERPIVQRLRFGQYAFFLDVFVLFTRSYLLIGIVFALSLPLVVEPGWSLVTDRREAVRELRAAIQRRGPNSLLATYGDFFWRWAGVAILILSSGILFVAVDALARV